MTLSWETTLSPLPLLGQREAINSNFKRLWKVHHILSNMLISCLISSEYFWIDCTMLVISIEDFSHFLQLQCCSVDCEEFYTLSSWKFPANFNLLVTFHCQYFYVEYWFCHPLHYSVVYTTWSVLLSVVDSYIFQCIKLYKFYGSITTIKTHYKWVAVMSFSTPLLNGMYTAEIEIKFRYTTLLIYYIIYVSA